jgi:Kef-type K+ transport system membrane component KefB
VIPVLLLLALGGLMHLTGTLTSAGAAGPELAFGYLLLSAYFNGKLVNRFGLPKLTGYILAGIVVGPHVLKFVQPDMIKQLKVVGDTATAILALQAGSEMDIPAIRPHFRVIRSLAFWAVFGTMLVLTGVLMGIRSMIPFLDAFPTTTALAVAGSLGIAMSAQSPAVVMALIGETKADGVVTRTILAMVVLADLAVIITYGIVSSFAAATVSGHADIADAVSTISWEVFGSLAVGAIVGLAIVRFLKSVGQGLGLFTIMVSFVMAEVGNAAHLDPLIILLTAGILVRNRAQEQAHVLVDGLDGGSLPVYLVFFALAGAKLELATLVDLAAPVAIIVSSRATSFFIGSKIGTARAGADPLVRKFAWMGLLPQAGLALALAQLVHDTFPSFGDKAFALIVGVVATNEMIAPIMLRIALLRSGEAGKRTTHDFAGSH